MSTDKNSTSKFLPSVRPTTKSCATKNSIITRIVFLELFLVVLFIIYVYILCAMLQYERKVRKRAKLKVRKRTGGIFNIKADDFAGAMRSCVVIACLGAIMRNVCEHLEVLLELTKDDYCDVIIKCKYIAAFVFFLAAYLFLWMRQRLCYTNHAMRHLSTKWARYCSWLSVVMILCVEILALSFYIGTQTHGRVEYGCGVISYRISPNIPYISMACGVFLFQITLSSLFIYPIMKHRTKVHSSNPSVKYANYMKLIKRVLIVLVITLTVNLTATVLAITVKTVDKYNVTIIICYNINLLAHLLAIVWAYPNWRGRLFSFCRKGVDMTEYNQTTCCRNQTLHSNYVCSINVISLESGDKFVSASTNEGQHARNNSSSNF